MPSQPISLHQALDSFDTLWRPQIIARINAYDVRVAKVIGDFVWHTHDDTDEFVLVLDGDLHIALRDADEKRKVHLPKGAIFVVPKGTEHKAVSAGRCFDPHGGTHRDPECRGSGCPRSGLRRRNDGPVER